MFSSFFSLSIIRTRKKHMQFASLQVFGKKQSAHREVNGALEILKFFFKIIA